MMQYMAKADSPTKGRDGTSHFGDIEKRNMVSPISMLGDLIPVLSGVALGARLQGRNVAVMTYIGDGGQSTGVTYEGINFAAVQNLGLVLFVESNLWAYSTPSEMQYRCKDLAERAIGYGIPGVIVDGTDACQVYDAAHEAVERAHRGEGPTLIEAKMMRMKGHAIHDAASYVPKPMFDFWKKRDPIARFENYLVKEKKWLTPKENEALIAEVEEVIEAEREIAVNSPMPTPESAEGGVFCEDGCHEIKPKYGMPKVKKGTGSLQRNRSRRAFEVAAGVMQAVELIMFTRHRHRRARRMKRSPHCHPERKQNDERSESFCCSRGTLCSAGSAANARRVHLLRVHDAKRLKTSPVHRHDEATCASELGAQEPHPSKVSRTTTTARAWCTGKALTTLQMRSIARNN